MNGGRAILANASPTAIKALLKRYNLGPKKRLGQHFLWQSHVVERIAESAELTKDDVVLEIGPGLGILTEALARQAGMVIAVEIDRALFPLLQEVLQDYDNIRLVEGDALKVNFDELLKECVPGFTGACWMRKNPGSDIAGVPASLTSAISLP
jgi:16S rRNA (adenine1518-N6/adenine1519-N6)-dimethyltransferase